ncbi:predicted protein [Lichtheimia corymbifera JMRC:FSU:9682]|uniref:Uncharacterized protein n=1 Tax=Lichtheimia corymbifera JMRC:FSU:9682 TaxID=1263082 RepID=A0A068RNT0_9FUNG|nr:predicted protein [Lichtheimia corymbifera JMRC:FSU:9682]
MADVVPALPHAYGLTHQALFPSSCYAWTTANRRHRAHHSSPETSTDSTRHLEQPTMRPLVYVNDRVTALAACGKFEEALREANTIQIAASSSAMFSSLQSLTLYEVTPDHPNPAAVFASLALARSTLTHLEIHFPFEWEPYPIEDILDTFRLLDDPTEMSTATTHPHLKELKLIPTFDNSLESHQLCYDIIDGMETYLNRPDLMSTIGAQVQKYKNCNDGFGSQFRAHDWMRPPVDKVTPLLEDGACFRW